MVLDSMKCPKCGLTQLAKPVCESCGASTGKSVNSLLAYKSIDSPAVSAGTPSPPRPAPLTEPAAPAPSPSRSVAIQTHRLSFHGNGGSLFGLYITNICLTLLTLGIYHFWGKTKIRNFLWSETEFKSDRFAYHGTGKELFIGSLKASFIFGILYAISKSIRYLPGGVSLKIGGMFLSFFLFLVFVPVAMVGAHRYRLSRTSWRGIRFSFRGVLLDFVEFYIASLFLNLITAGLYYPIYKTKEYAYFISQSYFGDQKFDFDGHGRSLIKSFLLSLLLTLPTLGFCWFWFAAAKKRFLMNHTRCGPARFHSTVTGGKLMLLQIGNIFIWSFSLGLAYPWVLVRNYQFAFKYMTCEGPLNMDAIHQDPRAASSTGEGLDSLMDINSGFSVA